MAITDIPELSDFGAPKTSAFPTVDATKQIRADDFNEVCQRVIDVTNAVGLDDGSTSGSLRRSVALSVKGNATNAAGAVADIAAASDGHVLRRSGTAIGFGEIAAAGIADGAVTDAKIRDSAGLSVVGRSANTTGDVADITAASDGHVLRRSGTALGFGTVATAGIADGAVTGAKIAQSGTLDIGAASITTTGTITTAGIKSGAGSPEGVTSASVGAIYRDTTNGWLWQKASGTGNTGWRIIGTSGTYTPTGAIVTNLDSVTPSVSMWIRVGNVVTVSGSAVVDPTASGSLSFRLSLPVASNFGALTDASGNGQVFSSFVQGDATNDALLVTVPNNSVTVAYTVFINASYRVL